MHLRIFLLEDHLFKSYDLGSVKFVMIKFIWLHDFNILVHVIFMIGQTAPCWDQINNIIHWGSPFIAKVLQNSLCLITISTVQDLPLQYYSLLEIRVWVISIQSYLICIFVVKGSQSSKDPKVTRKRDNGISNFVWNGATFQPELKMTIWLLDCNFPCGRVVHWYHECL